MTDECFALIFTQQLTMCILAVIDSNLYTSTSVDRCHYSSSLTRVLAIKFTLLWLSSMNRELNLVNLVVFCLAET